MANQVFIGLGSNTDVAYHLQQALHLLRDAVHVVAVSPVYETAPVGGGIHSYLNAVVQLETEHSPLTLKTEVLKVIEGDLGRVHNGDVVTIDLDILLFNDEQLNLGKRHIPDPGILQYAYIAVPLADIAPERKHPLTGESFKDVASRFQNAVGIQKRPDVDLRQL